MKIGNRLIWIGLLSGVLFLGGIDGIVHAQEDWQARFEEICAHGGEVMDLTPAQLQGLLTECEILRSRIEALPESPRKIYRKRWELACNLMRFALDQKNKPAPPSNE